MFYEDEIETEKPPDDPRNVEKHVVPT